MTDPKKLPFGKWFHTLWDDDGAIGMASIASKGFVAAIFNVIFGKGMNADSQIGTPLHLSRVAGCSEQEALDAIVEMETLIRVRDSKDAIVEINRHGSDGEFVEVVYLPRREENHRKAANAKSAQGCRDRKKQEPPRKKTEPKKKERKEPDPQKDWLADLPGLKAFVPELKRLFTAAFERLKPPPDDKIEKQLRDIAEIDNYSEKELLQTLVWWLTSDGDEAAWWRENGCQSIMSLRGKKDGGPTKFCQMFMKMKNGASSPKPGIPQAGAQRPETTKINVAPLAGEDIVRAEKVMAALKKKIDPESFGLWFAPTEFVRMEDRSLQIIVPSNLARNWLASHYMDAVRTEVDECFVKEKHKGIGFLLRDSVRIVEIPDVIGPEQKPKSE